MIPTRRDYERTANNDDVAGGGDRGNFQPKKPENTGNVTQVPGQNGWNENVHSPTSTGTPSHSAESSTSTSSSTGGPAPTGTDLGTAKGGLFHNNVARGDKSSQQAGLKDGPVYLRNVRQNGDRSELVANRLNSLLSSSNPYMKQAQTAGLQMANSRGMLNSSAAIQAAEAARINAALPIAQQDASTMFNQGLNNQNAANTYSNALLSGRVGIEQSNIQAQTALEQSRIQAEASLQGAHISAGASIAGAQISAAAGNAQTLANITAQIGTNPNLSPQQQQHGINIANNQLGNHAAASRYMSLPNA